MKKKFSVPDMSCGHCVNRIRARLGESDRIAILEISLESATVSLDTDLAGEEVLTMLEDAGYPATEIPL